MRVELEIPMTLGEISDAIDSVSPYPKQAIISAVTTDTREALFGDLFIAVTGDGDSGENYVSDALGRGCYVISSNRKECLNVSDTCNALLKIAEHYKSKLNIKHTVAVTGSVGKSTTVKFLKRIISSVYRTHAPSGNFNNALGVPLTIFATPRDTEVLILEFGMNHKNEISRLSKCAHPTVGAITSIGSAHIGNLGTREDIAKAKLEILDGMDGGAILLPYNEPLLSGIKDAMYFARNSSLSHFSLDGNGDSYSLRSPYGVTKGISFFDKREHLLDDLALAASISQIIGLPSDSIVKGIRAINREDIRQRFIEADGFVVFDDSYNASYESIIADLKYIKALGKHTGAFLGDVLELGESAEQIHRKIGYDAAKMKIDHLYLYGKYAEYTALGAILGGMDKDHIYINTDTEAAKISIEQIIKNHYDGEIILFKASHKLRLDKIADEIVKMSHHKKGI